MKGLLTCCVGNIMKSKNVEWDGQIDDKWLEPPAALDTSLKDETTRTRLEKALHEQKKKSAQVGAAQRKLGACAEKVASVRKQLEEELSRQTEIEAEVDSLKIAENAAKACVDSLQEELKKESTKVARVVPVDGEEEDEDLMDTGESAKRSRAGDDAAAADANMELAARRSAKRVKMTDEQKDEERQAELEKLVEAAAAAELERVQELEGITSRKKARLDEAERQRGLAEAERVAAERAKMTAADAATVKAQS